MDILLSLGLMGKKSGNNATIIENDIVNITLRFIYLCVDDNVCQNRKKLKSL